MALTTAGSKIRRYPSARHPAGFRKNDQSGRSDGRGGRDVEECARRGGKKPARDPPPAKWKRRSGQGPKLQGRRHAASRGRRILTVRAGRLRMTGCWTVLWAAVRAFSEMMNAISSADRLAIAA